MRWLRLHHLQVLTEGEDDIGERPGAALLLGEPKLKTLAADMADQPGPGRQGKCEMPCRPKRCSRKKCCGNR